MAVYVRREGEQMPAPSLASLNERTIAVDLQVEGRHIHVRGTGRFETLTPGGPVLKIHVADPAGDFDILLHEGRFTGPIVEDAETGEIRIQLQAPDLCAPSP
jgi:hypothetical protein